MFAKTVCRFASAVSAETPASMRALLVNRFEYVPAPESFGFHLCDAEKKGRPSYARAVDAEPFFSRLTACFCGQ